MVTIQNPPTLCFSPHHISSLSLHHSPSREWRTFQPLPLLQLHFFVKLHRRKLTLLHQLGTSECQVSHPLLVLFLLRIFLSAVLWRGRRNCICIVLILRHPWIVREYRRQTHRATRDYNLPPFLRYSFEKTLWYAPWIFRTRFAGFILRFIRFDDVTCQFLRGTTSVIFWKFRFFFCIFG